MYKYMVIKLYLLYIKSYITAVPLFSLLLYFYYAPFNLYLIYFNHILSLPPTSPIFSPLPYSPNVMLTLSFSLSQAKQK